MSEMKLIMESWRSFLNEAAVNHTDTSGRHQKTGQVEFSWGKYKGKLKGELYYSSEGKLGDIQRNGDPYTYEYSLPGLSPEFPRQKLRVVSAPESGEKSIGVVLSREKSVEILELESGEKSTPSDTGSRKVKEAKPNDLHPGEVEETMDLIADLTVGEFTVSDLFYGLLDNAGEEYLLNNVWNQLAEFWTGKSSDHDPSKWRLYSQNVFPRLGFGGFSDTSDLFAIPKTVNPAGMTIAEAVEEDLWREMWDPYKNPALGKMIDSIMENKDVSLFDDRPDLTPGVAWAENWPWPLDPVNSALGKRALHDWVDVQLNPEKALGLKLIRQGLKTGVMGNWPIPGGARHLKNAIRYDIAIIRGEDPGPKPQPQQPEPEIAARTSSEEDETAGI